MTPSPQPVPGAPALAIRDLRWVGLIQIVLFFALLLTGFVYIWRKGVLDWSRRDD